MRKSLSTFSLALFSSILFIAIFFVMPAGVYAEKDEYGRDLPDKIAPKNISIEQLHKNIYDKEHRYKLTIAGEKIKDRGSGVLADWFTTCGRFYSKSRGILDAETSVIWGYDYPDENCENVVINISIKDHVRGDTVKIEQKIFFPEENPIVNTAYKKHRTPFELWKDNLFRWIKIKVGVFWSNLKPNIDDATETEVPSGSGAIRG